MGTSSCARKSSPSKHAVVLLHVQQLDGKDVGGIAQLLEREDQRRRMAFAPPPLSDRLKLGEFARQPIVSRHRMFRSECSS